MPRSSKAPDPPPEPDINEAIQNDVARIKRLLGLDVNRLALGSEVEGIVTDALLGSLDYTVTGTNVIEFVNVSSSIGPSQGGSGFRAEVTGLTVTPHAGEQYSTRLHPGPQAVSRISTFTMFIRGQAAALLLIPLRKSLNLLLTVITTPDWIRVRRIIIVFLRQMMHY